MTSSVNETRSSTRKRSALLLRAYMVSIAMVWSCASDARADAREGSPYAKLEVFARALAHIEQSYVDRPDGERLIQGAIRGMLEELDPHSQFLTPEQLRVLADDSEGRYAGIGVEIDVRDGWLTVSNVLEGGAAAAAGVRPGDKFLSIEGRGARDLPIEQAVQLMRGEPGTRVRVALRRPGVEQALSLELTRAIVEVRAVDARTLEGGLGYLRLRAFQETTANEAHRALDILEEAARDAGGLRGLVLDLRDNPGGLVHAAVRVADELLDEGVIVETRGRDGRVQRTESASTSPTRAAFPVVVLVNARTASAAEILAGALRDHRRAVLVGTRTFGKGSVQNVIDLPDGSALKLTTGRYYTPAGQSIQATGIEPDVHVEAVELADASALEPETIREGDLERHLAAAQPARVAAPPPSRAARTSREAASREAAEPFADDFQARMGLQVLKALLAAQH